MGRERETGLDRRVIDLKKAYCRLEKHYSYLYNVQSRSRRRSQSQTQSHIICIRPPWNNGRREGRNGESHFATVINDQLTSHIAKSERKTTEAKK